MECEEIRWPLDDPTTTRNFQVTAGVGFDLGQPKIVPDLIFLKKISELASKQSLVVPGGLDGLWRGASLSMATQHPRTENHFLQKSRRARERGKQLWHPGSCSQGRWWATLIGKESNGPWRINFTSSLLFFLFFILLHLEGKRWKKNGKFILKICRLCFIICFSFGLNFK